MEQLKCLRAARMDNGHDRRYKGCKGCGEDGLYLSIADGDFAFSEVIREEVGKVVESGNLAYEYFEEENAKKIVQYYKKHYQLSIKKDDILFGNGVLYWIQIAIHTLTHHGEGVIIQPPVYDAFDTIIKQANRKVIEAPLKFANNKYSIDFKKLEEAFKIGKLFIFCSPHNPTGNVWTKQELLKIMQLAKKYNVYVVSDEIWQDVIFKKEFTSMLHMEEYQENIIHVSSPAKTFNLGGIQFGIAIVKNKKLNNSIKSHAASIIKYSSSQPWVSTAIQTAYGNKKAWDWFELYLKQIHKNYKKLEKLIKDLKLEYSKADSNYLVFLKMGNSKYQGQKLEKELKKYGLHFGMGYIYGTNYNEWIRINIAICDNSMKLLLEKLEKFYKEKIK